MLNWVVESTRSGSRCPAEAKAAARVLLEMKPRQLERAIDAGELMEIET
jgi:hypothetical protein